MTVSRNLPFWKSSLPKLSGGCWPWSLFEQRLGIVGVDLAGAALHEERDHALGGGREVRLLGRERAGGIDRGHAGLLEEIEGGKPAEPHPGVL